MYDYMNSPVVTFRMRSAFQSWEFIQTLALEGKFTVLAVSCIKRPVMRISLGKTSTHFCNIETQESFKLYSPGVTLIWWEQTYMTSNLHCTPVQTCSVRYG